jgi:hypothetical protein
MRSGEQAQRPDILLQAFAYIAFAAASLLIVLRMYVSHVL